MKQLEDSSTARLPNQESKAIKTVNILDMRKELEQRLAEEASAVRASLLVHDGKPIFRPESLLETVNPIARLVRLIFLDQNITEEYFREVHSEIERAEGKLPKDVNTIRNNLLKALSKERMSVPQFERILTILGFNILDITYALLDSRTGEVRSYSLSDIPPYLEAHRVIRSAIDHPAIPQEEFGVEVDTPPIDEE